MKTIKLQELLGKITPFSLTTKRSNNNLSECFTNAQNADGQRYWWNKKKTITVAPAWQRLKNDGEKNTLKRRGRIGENGLNGSGQLKGIGIMRCKGE